MTLREQIVAWADANDVVLIFFEPPAYFDAAIVGLIHGAGQSPAVLYDEAKVRAAMRADMPDDDDADAWFDFNTLGAFLGEQTPRFLTKPWEEEDTDVKQA